MQLPLAKTPAERALEGNQRVIAVDFDDVIARTNEAVCHAHNKEYGTDWTLDDFESVILHRNRGWGSIEDVHAKLRIFHERDILLDTEPVACLDGALRQLKAMGHPLHIVTSRGPGAAEIFSKWLAAHKMTELFDGVHFTGYPEDFDKTALKVRGTKVNDMSGDNVSDKGDSRTVDDEITKTFANLLRVTQRLSIEREFSLVPRQTLRQIEATLLIDDNVDNTDKVATAGIQCLLFGDYRWNSRRWGMDTPEDALNYDARIKAGIKLPEAKMEMKKGVTRVSNWDEVVEWVKNWDREAVA